MGKKLNEWLDEFVEQGEDPSDVTNWPQEAGGGTTVIANPELSGGESLLQGIQIGDTKYKVSGGSSSSGKLFKYILYLRNESISLDFKIAFYHTKDVDIYNLDTTSLKNGALTDLFGLTSNEGFTYEQFFGWGDDGKMIIKEIIAIKTNNKITGFRLGFYNLDTSSISEYTFDFDSSAWKVQLSE